MRKACSLAFALCLCLAPSTPFAGQLSVGQGSTMTLGTGAADLGCNHLVVDGTFQVARGAATMADDVQVAAMGLLHGGSGLLELSGDFDVAGSFLTGNSGTVEINDDCGSRGSIISGGHSFSNLALTTTTGKTYVFESGSTTTVANSIVISGSVRNSMPAVIRSDTPGGTASLAFTGGSQSIGLVDVEDVHATSKVLFADTGSTIGINAFGWVIGAVVPAIGVVGTLALAALVIAGARRLLDTEGESR